MANKKTLDLVKHFESLHDGDLSMIGLQPKLCPANVWTEGYGRAMINPKTGKLLKGANNKSLAYSLSTIKTEAEAGVALSRDIVTLGEMPAEAALGQDYWKRANENMKGGLASFVYNCGTHNPATGKPYMAFQKLREYLDNKISAGQLKTYWESSVIKGGGKVLAGLVRRRKAEVHLIITGELNLFL